MNFIFGLGTGRCGSCSLSALLNAQYGSYITHERGRLPWKVDLVKLGRFINQIEKRQENFVGDIGFWYLQYVEYIIQEIPEAIFVCLKRDMESTVKSFIEKVPSSNHWTDPNSKYWKKENDVFNETWSPCFPKYFAYKEDALREYWREYYQRAEQLESRIERFKIFDMNKALNDEEVQTKLLEFVGVERKRQILCVGLKSNTSGRD